MSNLWENNNIFLSAYEEYQILKNSIHSFYKLRLHATFSCILYRCAILSTYMNNVSSSSNFQRSLMINKRQNPGRNPVPRIKLNVSLSFIT